MMKMNKIQKAYMVSKVAYDLAFKNENWEMVDQLEDPMLDAEFALIEWTFEEVEKTRQMPQQDIDFLRKHMNPDQMHKIADMGLRLSV